MRFFLSEGLLEMNGNLEVLGVIVGAFMRPLIGFSIVKMVNFLIFVLGGFVWRST